METQHMSERVFVGLCQEVGTSSVVAMRRDVMSVSELIENEFDKDIAEMVSGSRREGFRFEGSDMDLMYWRTCNRVIWDLSQASYYQSSKLTPILADCSESLPGFALLQLVIPTADSFFLAVHVKMNGKHYISSALYKIFIQKYMSKFNLKIHGPCLNGKGHTESHMEVDYADCFVSDFWPPHASSWIERCHFWPPSYILNDILKSGCHFVAIGNKSSNQENNEWRISFSLAEQKLVYSMSHCQFLTYGLLKIFLKEVINDTSDENKLLCSYHVKTAVFWTIQTNTIPCLYPQNFLEGFWMCFKLVIKWVYEGSCPNFFIPRNNMFLTKIFGATQNKLFSKLNGLYEKGYSCLLESCTIMSYMQLPISFNCCNEAIEISDIDFILELSHETLHYETWKVRNLSQSVKVLHSIEHVFGLPLKQCQIIVLQKVTVSILQNIAFLVSRSFIDSISQNLNSNVYVVRGGNKMAYIIDKISFCMLKIAAKLTLGCFSDMLYIVIYFYKTYRYHEASDFLKMTKVKLLLLKENTFASGTARNIDTATEFSSTTMIRASYDMYVRLDNKISYISELMLEQYYSLQNSIRYLQVSSLILLHMLDFLCYKSVDSVLSQAALEQLQNKVYKNQDENTRDTSWQILGICQQILGNHQAALYAFHQALTAHPSNQIQQATIVKILIMIANIINHKKAK